MIKLEGVYPILPTPFTDQDELDEASLRRLIDFMTDVGVHGVAILGFMGEAQKLTSEERRRVISIVAKQSRSRLQVLVGVQAFGTAGAVEQAVEAKEQGAGAVFVAPIGVQNDNVLFNFYRDVAEQSSVPVMIHDFPESFGITMSPELISRLGNGVDGIVGIKLEEPPVLIKVSHILDVAPHMAIFGGLGGEYYIEELQRGAKGIMTGFAFPEVLLEIFQKFTSGDEVGATKTFDRYCPLIRYEFQPKIGLAFRKHIYKQRGIFGSNFIRSPGFQLDERSRKELEHIIARVGLRLDALGPSV